MDSTSSSLPIASGDALFSTAVVVSEDDGSLSIAAGLAKEAGLLFQVRKYVDCLRVLNQLLQRKEDDPKDMEWWVALVSGGPIGLFKSGVNASLLIHIAGLDWFVEDGFNHI
ncbi:Hypothetical predicted protein [Olea europaea subsp. europaea]|uniref:Uncharacterized protein n=1 Tax=Olea europaea subsp. europaea TaxID=158383 RepID=A0A8S0PF84_OLEEU|nr:Hypothetical predicted protein [Olea europaea subsp. europaea]